MEHGETKGLGAPEADDAYPARYPDSWYRFGSLDELRRGPLTKEMVERRLVGFLTDGGQPAVLDARCSHLGSDLGRGRVVGDAIECPFHGWRYGADGVCLRVPSMTTPPDFAGQRSYETATMLGDVFVHLDGPPRFPLPFFDDLDPSQLVAVRPLEFIVDAPWFVVAANGVDRQHFLNGHDRRLIDGPHLSIHDDRTLRSEVTLEVVPGSIRDRLLRAVAGSTVVLRVDDWSSSVLFVRSTMERAETLSVVSLVPLGRRRTSVHIRIVVDRGTSPTVRALANPIGLVKRYAVRKFLEPDVGLLAGVDYDPARLLEVDQPLRDYIRWLNQL